MVANGFEGVPWMIGGGAQHSSDIGRVLAYAALGGGEGIISPGDCKVVASAGVADGNVHVGLGGVGILTRSTGINNEAYAGRSIQVSDLAVAPTGSVGRSDMVVVRVEDPQFPPWSAYDSTTQADQVKNGPYIFPRVISNVPATAIHASDVPALNGQSAIPLARIDIPPNTTAITNAMIKDMRRIAHPQTLRNQVLQPGPSTATTLATADHLAVANTAWRNWPLNQHVSLYIPRWATLAQISIRLNGFYASNLGSNANTRISLGTAVGPVDFIDYNGNPALGGNFAERIEHTCYGDFDVTAVQGQTVNLQLQAQRVTPSNAGDIWIDYGTQIIYDIQFLQLPV